MGIFGTPPYFALKISLGDSIKIGIFTLKIGTFTLKIRVFTFQKCIFLLQNTINKNFFNFFVRRISVVIS